MNCIINSRAGGIVGLLSEGMQGNKLSPHALYWPRGLHVRDVWGSGAYIRLIMV